MADAIIQNEQSKTINSPEPIYYESLLAEYIYHFNYKNRVECMGGHVRTDVSGFAGGIVHENSLTVKLFNKFESLSLFNEVSYIFDDEKTRYTDYNVAVRYAPTRSLSISLKGENLLDDAVPQTFYRMDPTVNPPQMLPPVSVSPFEKRVYLSLDYLF